MIFVDTDVMIDLLRQYPPAVAWLNSLGNEEIVLPGFVVMELIQGCRNSAERTAAEMQAGRQVYLADRLSAPAACWGAVRPDKRLGTDAVR